MGARPPSEASSTRFAHTRMFDAAARADGLGDELAMVAAEDSPPTCVAREDSRAPAPATRLGESADVSMATSGDEPRELELEPEASGATRRIFRSVERAASCRRAVSDGLGVSLGVSSSQTCARILSSGQRCSTGQIMCVSKSICKRANSQPRVETVPADSVGRKLNAVRLRKHAC